MRTYRLALIGFGNVGQGLAQILCDRRAELAARFGVDLQIVAVSDVRKGSLYDPAGLDPALLLATVQRDGHLAAALAPVRGWDALSTIAESNADVVVEMSYTDLRSGEPAITHLRRALELGKHALTTNKGPAALAYRSLAELARRKGVEIGVEGTVMSGTPALRLGSQLLAGAGIRRVQGILNGTSNYILSRMEDGAAYTEALREAQDRGFAEADPSGDVEGYDAAGKVVILSNLLLGGDLVPDDVDRRGITGLSTADIAAAQRSGERWRLLGCAEKENGHIRATVKPVRLPLSHPLAGVRGATNAITYTTDLLGDVTLIGPGAGRIETGYALISDLLAIHAQTQAGMQNRWR